MPVLLIIDMQKFFSAANERCTIAACKREIKKFMKRQWPILFVEYEPWGPTLPELKDLTAAYTLVETVSKYQDGGGYEVNEALKKQSWTVDEIHFCGVNADACVAWTIRELKHWRAATPMFAIADAINTNADPLSASKSDYILQHINSCGVNVKNEHLLLRQRKAA